MGARPRRYRGWKIAGAVVVLVALDFVSADLANRIIWNWPNFFEDILARTDVRYTDDPKRRTYTYQDCEWHRALLLYTARTCFSASGRSIPAEGGFIDATNLYFWSTLPVSMRWLSDIHYDSGGAVSVFLVARENKRILEDLRND